MQYFEQAFSTRNRWLTPRRGRQSGAALFTALMILIILSILAVAAARVTALQERMSGIYLADVRAFQRAEDGLRDSERQVLTTDPDVSCNSPPQPGNGIPGVWGDGEVGNIPVDDRRQIENLNNPRSPSSRGIGLGRSLQGGSLELGGAGCLFFRLSSVDFDGDGGGSRAIVQSSFVP